MTSRSISPTRDASAAFERAYRTALAAHVRTGRSSGEPMGRRAARLGVATLELARIHDRAAAAAPRRRPRSAASAAREAAFFAGAVAPLEHSRCGWARAGAEHARTTALLTRRTRELAEARARLVRQDRDVRSVRTKLARTERLHGGCDGRARLVEERLRRLSHRLLTAQEEERMRISRDLHDAIGQTLTGINVGLATLRNESAADSRDLADAIALTQRLVERSMRTVHQFAWELRPTLLDDLGLVPALRSYAKTFAERTGVKLRFASPTRLEGLDAAGTTALFRVAQGALSNVERHARAVRASLVVRALPGAVRLEVSDHGRSFDVRAMDRSKSNKHLGLLVMRERIEMVGGTFSIESSRARGTRVRADVPLAPQAAHV
jgi:signal transduction histidine kinase